MPLATVVMSAATLTDEQFNRFVSSAADAGATHVHLKNHAIRPLECGPVSAKAKHEIPWSNDPYLQWSIVHFTFFRTVVPEELKGILDEEYARRNLDYLVKQCVVLRRYGLRAFIRITEPMCLPESVFRRYPSWRGPRVDHPRRSRHPQYAPCTDNAEVLDVYRRTVARVIEQVPELDILNNYTNDSGAGFCWTQHLYPNANGPSKCKMRSMSERVIGFYGAIQDGARDAGVNIQIRETNYFSHSENHELLAHKKENIHFCLKNMSSYAVDPMRKIKAETATPLIGVQQPVDFSMATMLAFRENAKQLYVDFGHSILDGTFPIYESYYKNALRQCPAGLATAFSLLENVSIEHYGPKAGRMMMEAWMKIRDAHMLTPFFGVGGSLLMLYHLMQRVLVRPFVAFPLDLPLDDRQYYQKHQFQAGSEIEASNLLNHQGTQSIQGIQQARMAKKILKEITEMLDAALKKMEQAASSEGITLGSDENLRLGAMRVQAAIHLYRSLANAFIFQTYVDQRRQQLGALPAELEPVSLNSKMDRDIVCDHLRDEIDNINELILLLRSTSKPLLHTALTSEDEDPFTFGPDLVEQLERKVNIMLDHWIDFDRLWAPPNK